MNEMRAVVIDRFGGPEVLSVGNVPVPEPKPDEILVRVDSAGIGVWDGGIRDGLIARMFGIQPKFPWILGSEGAGKVVEVGDKVTDFKKGDLVYSSEFATNPMMGFQAEYKAANAGKAWRIPSTLTTEKAGPLLIDGATALRGLDDTLQLKQDEKLMIFGASGGLGHLAIQFARRMGAHVFAVASGDDGIALALKLGAEAAVDGHGDNTVASAHKFAPNGFDAALVTVASEVSEKALTTMREGGRVAHPWVNQRPPPKAPSGVRVLGYNGNIDPPLVLKMNKLVEEGRFEVHLGKTFKLDQVVDGYKTLGSHYLGRLAIFPSA